MPDDFNPDDLRWRQLSDRIEALEQKASDLDVWELQEQIMSLQAQKNALIRFITEQRFTHIIDRLHGDIEPFISDLREMGYDVENIRVSYHSSISAINNLFRNRILDAENPATLFNGLIKQLEESMNEIKEGLIEEVVNMFPTAILKTDYISDGLAETLFQMDEE